LVPDRAAARFGTEHLTVLIRSALAFAAHYISILILDAIPCIDLGTGGQGHKATNNDERTRKARHECLLDRVTS
jgi:hypothetical protein